jgi:hypothetical protein
MPAGCTALKSLFSSPWSDIYNQQNFNQWSNATIFSPGCVFTLTTSQQLACGSAQIIAQITELKTPFTVYSGGHMSNPSCAYLDWGVDTIGFDDAAKIARPGWVCSGAKVYEFLLPYGVIVVVGRVSPAAEIGDAPPSWHPSKTFCRADAWADPLDKYMK